MARQWTEEQKAAARERAKNQRQDPEKVLEAFQKRTGEVAEQVQAGVAVMERRDDSPYWPGGAPKVYVRGHLIPEGYYHTIVTEHPASYELPSAFHEIESSGKGYKMLVALGPTKRIYICPMEMKRERERLASQQARGRVIGVITQPGTGDLKQITTKTSSGPADIDSFMAQHAARGQMSTADLLDAAEQSRSAALQEDI